MSAFNLQESLERAEKRLGSPEEFHGKLARSDRGVSRLNPIVIECLTKIASGMEKPRMTEMLKELALMCEKKGIPKPSRATVYKLLDKLPAPSYKVNDLPESVRNALYNLSPSSEVPGHQLAFYCFNYGTMDAVSFAASLPWLAVYQALKLPGYRKKSRGLALAVATARNII
jgi:hypothetical protein